MKQNEYFPGFSHGFGRVPKTRVSRLNESIAKIRDSVGQGLYRVFEEVLPAEGIRLRVGERRRSYDSRSTLWAMLSQVFRQSSLRDAVRELQAIDGLSGLPIRSGNTGPYSKARQRLCFEAVKSMHDELYRKLEQGAKDNQRGRLLSVDATSVRLDDTDSNRSAYGYAPSQKPGCGYPVMQLVTLKDLNCGAVVETIDSPNRAGESPLFSAGLMPYLRAEDIILADRAYCGYYNFVCLNRMGASALMRLHGTRDTSALKKCDDTVTVWTKPRRGYVPAHVSNEQYSEIPQQLSIRLIRARIEQPGFRSQEILLATTLFNKPAAEIIALYRRRWEIETGFRHIKTTMGMDHIHVKSPEMARKQIYLFFIAHNLIYWLMQKANDCASALSFKGTLDCLNRWACEMTSLGRQRLKEIRSDMLDIIAKDKVPLRPDRMEPRCVKTRAKRYDKLNVHRHLIYNQIRP